MTPGPATTGANVVLASAYDPIVFERGWTGTDFPCVSVVQIAVDLLTSTMPADGAAIIEWMRRYPTRWRSTSLRAA